MSEVQQSGVLINRNPSPRLLIRGFKNQEALVEKLRDLAPTSLVIGSLRQVRQAEWDVLITDASLTEGAQAYLGPVHLAPHMFAIYVAPESGLGGTVESRDDWSGSIEVSGSHICQEIRRLKGLPERIAELTHEHLEPVLMKRTKHQYFDRRVWQQVHARRITPASEEDLELQMPPEVTPFILSADGDILAGSYMRSAESQAWILPGDIPDLLVWARAAFAVWHGIAPDRFPGIPDWSREDRWMMPAERDIVLSLTTLKVEREEALRSFESREKELRRELQEVRTLADSYERALLTTQSSDLETVVAKALRELGFVVVEADEFAAPGDNLEDLHIKDPSDDEWIALGEVKGYSKGAKTEAISQFIRFTMRFQQRTGKVPSACWYIVNQFLGRDPSTRQKVLHGKDDDIAAFASAGGLVIDTVVLFDLMSKVRRGLMTADEARKLLRSSTGRFSL